jgi:prepilin-type N-terminal cleavage/methylation domain-containing protein
MKVLVDIQNKRKASTSVVKSAGFTLIELLVVLAIFALVMGVALFNQAGLNSNIMITNLAYETALAVREAQTYGISVRATSFNSGLNFDKGYGAYFDIDNPMQFVVFGDSSTDSTPPDNTYTAGATPSELQSLYEVRNQRGNRITAICVGKSDSASKCWSGSADSVSKLSIMFKRPNPESTFFVSTDGVSFTKSDKSPAIIVVNNTDGTNCRAIVVEVTGQIRVENSSGGNCVDATTRTR